MSKQAQAEKPLPLGTRVYKKHRKILRYWSKFLSVKNKKVSEAEVNRRAIEFFDEMYLK